MILNLAGSLLYFIAAALCFMAAMRAQEGRKSVVWPLVGLVFVALAATRISGAEEMARDWLREILREDGAYAIRRQIQAPIAVAALVIALAVAALVWRYAIRARRLPSARSRVVAIIGALAMVLLLALRIISLHVVDAVLYRGLHLNWFIDGGATLAVAWAGWFHPIAQEREAAARERHRKARKREG